MVKTSMIAAAVMLSAGAFAFAAPASATPASLGGAVPALDQQASNVELVQYRKVKRKWAYNARRHGQRYRYRHRNFRYHYGGWWYNRPWWGYGGPTIAFGIGPAYGGYYGAGVGDGHVQWCLNRYRSYDPRTDTYMGYDGYRHRCNSPY